MSTLDQFGLTESHNTAHVLHIVTADCYDDWHAGLGELQQNWLAAHNFTVKPGAAIIDVGINQLDDGSIVGDVDYDSVLPLAGWVTPVPGGVGTVTTAMLMQNTIVAAKRQLKHYEAAFGPGHVATNAAMSSHPQ